MTETIQQKDTKKKEIPDGYKQTKIGLLPEEWDLVQFNEILEFKNGVNASKEDYGTGVKFVNVLEIIENNSLKSNDIPGSVTITEKQLKRYKVKKGDILFNRTSETRKEIGLNAVYLDSKEAVFGGFVIRGRFKKEIYLNCFKKYVFGSKHIRKQITRKGQGAIRINIGQSDLGQVYTPTISKKEQGAIADCLTTWDDAIETLSDLIEAKEKQKKGLMQRLLTGRVRLINPATSKRFTEEWKEVKFKRIFEKIKNTEPDKDYQVYSVTKDGIVSQEEYFNKKVASKDTSKYLVVKQGEFVMSGLNFWMGSYDIYNGQKPVKVSPAYKTFKTNSEVVNPVFIQFYVQTQDFLKCMVVSSVQGASVVRRNLDKTTMKNFGFMIPALAEQKAIANILSKANEEINLLKEKVKRFKEQKKGLMQVLLTGKKRLV